MKKFVSLAETQRLIQKTVRNKSISEELLALIVEKPPISIHERLNIYQNAYFIRLSESLRDDFSRVEDQIDTEEFNKIIIEYIMQNPSKTSNLAEYSKAFPDFIKSKKIEAYAFAQKDWMEILSRQAAEPNSNLSWEEIKSGKAFTVKVHPATNIIAIEEGGILSYRKSEEIFFQEVNYEKRMLLEFLRKNRTLDSLAKFSDELGVEQDLLMSTIFEWIKDGIIFCERDSND